MDLARNVVKGLPEKLTRCHTAQLCLVAYTLYYHLPVYQTCMFPSQGVQHLLPTEPIAWRIEIKGSKNVLATIA